jgi:hypothetical protein
MNEQCQLAKPAPLLREEPYSMMPSPEIFCKTPPFRCDLVFAPGDKDWQRIASGIEISGGCLTHPKERISYKNKKYQLKRLFYEWFVEPLSDNQEVKNTCDNRKCLYPLHLHARKKVSHADSVFRMWKNRESDRGLNQQQRADKYGVPLHVVRRKDQGKSYKYLPSSIPDESLTKNQFNFLAPPSQLLVFEPPPEQ